VRRPMILGGTEQAGMAILSGLLI
jgi:hypothetical protein